MPRGVSILFQDRNSVMLQVFEKMRSRIYCSSRRLIVCDLLQIVCLFRPSQFVLTSCSVVVGYHRFGGPCCIHLQGCDSV